MVNQAFKKASLRPTNKPVISYMSDLGFKFFSKSCLDLTKPSSTHSFSIHIYNISKSIQQSKQYHGVDITSLTSLSSLIGTHTRWISSLSSAIEMYETSLSILHTLSQSLISPSYPRIKFLSSFSKFQIFQKSFSSDV